MKTSKDLINIIESLENKKEVILLSDIDGVTIDWLDGFIKYCEKKGHKAKHNKPKEFGMTDIFPTLEKPWELIKDYQDSEEYSNIKAYPEAVEVYNKLYDMGVKIIFVTSCITSDKVEEVRTKTMKEEFNGKFDHIEYLDFGASKLEVLNKYPSATYIDDQLKMAIEGSETGHDSFVMDMSYNQNDNDNRVNRLYHFNQLIPYFEKKIGLKDDKKLSQVNKNKI